MALINCPDCGAEVSDAAPACPKCGRPIASVPSPAGADGERARGRSHTTVTVTLSSFVLIVLAIAAAVWFVPALGVGQHIEAYCQVNGMGQGTCQFTNTGWTPGAQCADIKLHNQHGGTVSSGPVCSGRVRPNDTTEKNVMMAIGHTCDDPDTGMPDLNKMCTMEVSNADSGDADLATPSSAAAAAPVATGTVAPAPDGAAGASATADASPAADASVAPVPAATALSLAQASSVAAPATATTAAAQAPQSPTADAAGPSFDCSQATDPTSTTICGNADLAQLDRQMAALYFARAQATTDPAVRDGQREWLRVRNACGADVACLREQYAARIQQLQQN